MADFKVVARAKLLAITSVLHSKILHLLIVLGVKSAHHVRCGALDSAVMIAPHRASCTLTQISISPLNLSIDEIIVCESKCCRFEIALFAIGVHSSAHIARTSSRYSMLHMM